ncbi:MAG TPA: Ig-like domain-containing protein [Candidatus Angelobacter sp.]|nr:Ig-like domain-containing protein [Candidatus Angelobacter sp.]
MIQRLCTPSSIVRNLTLPHYAQNRRVPGGPSITTMVFVLAAVFALVGQAGAQTIVSSFAGNGQHTAVYNPAAQHLNSVHWTTSIDLNNTGAFAHYGAPLITPANTIIVPQKTGSSGGFAINVFNAVNGTALYSLTTDYTQPTHNWILSYQPGLAVNSVDTRLYYPGNGGTIYYIDNPDSVSHGAPVQQVFYTTLANYQANASAFNSTVFINTPITSDSSGNVFFGFRVQGTAPAPLSTTQSGFARIDPNGNATFVLAGTAASDANIGQDSHNSAPALSNDQTTLYVVVKGASNQTYGYLLGLDSTTLATKFKVFLKDPRNNNANNAEMLDDSTASPMVGPDGDVYFGIMGNPFNGSRGFMLHFSGDLTVEQPAGGFGWDNTAAIVPASMVPSYTGTSSYLLFTKYNNYADGGGDNGDGINRIALLDPNATEVDAHASSNGMLIMREVMTVIGPTADAALRSTSFPHAIREWCINTAAVNPATNSIFTPSEDGRTYRWNLVTNSLTEWVTLSTGIGEPYVPTIIGPDGTVFTLNGGLLSALGNINGVGIAVTSSTPDLRTVVTGQSLTFTAAVTNTGTSGTIPTGTVTFTDTTYSVVSGALQTTTTTLASNVALDGNGNATFTSSTLTGDFHFITVQYSGDSNFSAGSASLVQTVHASGSSTALASTPNPSNGGQSVTFTATLTAVPPGTGTPTGQVTFQQGNTVLAQVPLNSSGAAAFSTSALATGSDTITATYASDFSFAASSGSTVQTVQNFATTTTVTSTPNPSTFGQSVSFTASVTSSSGAPVGTVTFTQGSNVLASNVVVDSNGHAAFSTAALAVGSNTITAAFTGGTGWANSSGSDSGSPQVVNKSATTTAVSSSANPSVFSQPVTFTAPVTATAPGSGVPSGTVTFKNGSSTLGTGTLDGNGNATFTTSTLTVGSHSITAVDGGSTSFTGSTSSVLTQTVNKDGTTSSVTSSLNPSTHGQSVTFTATVVASAPGTAVPTGSVTFKDGTKSLGSKTLSSGQATLSTSSLSRGSHSITVVYGGSSNFLGSTSAVLVQVVN